VDFLYALVTTLPHMQTPAYQSLGNDVLEFEQQRPFTVEPSMQVPSQRCRAALSCPVPFKGVHAMNKQVIENDNWSDVRNELRRRLPGFEAPVWPGANDEPARATLVGCMPGVSKDANGKNGGESTYLAATPNVASIVASPRAASGAPIVRAFWWGFHIECSSQGLRDFIGGASSVNDIAAAIGPVTGPAAPWVTLAAAFISGALALLQSLDRGNGVYISMSWFALGIFVPTSVPGTRKGLTPAKIRSRASREVVSRRISFRQFRCIGAEALFGDTIDIQYDSDWIVKGLVVNSAQTVDIRQGDREIPEGEGALIQVFQYYGGQAPEPILSVRISRAESVGERIFDINAGDDGDPGGTYRLGIALLQ
jgi:hypothetical protein